MEWEDYDFRNEIDDDKNNKKQSFFSPSKTLRPNFDEVGMGLKSFSDGVGTGLKKVTDLKGMNDKLKHTVSLNNIKSMASKVTDVSKIAEDLKKAGGDIVNKMVGDEERIDIEEETQSA